MVQRPKAYLWCGPAAQPQPNLQKKLSICEKQLRESAESSEVKKQINKQKKGEIWDRAKTVEMGTVTCSSRQEEKHQQGKVKKSKEKNREVKALW